MPRDPIMNLAPSPTLTVAPQNISVVVPSYRRPAALKRCLRAVACQSMMPKEIIVARRSNDEETANVLSQISDPKIVEVLVDVPGQIAALAAAVSRSSGEIVAFTDDDAVPKAHWLERMSTHFRDPTVGGVGGRDIVHDSCGSVDASTEDASTEDVGRIGHWGKPYGNHHLGTGPPRDVEILKGVNMAFRRAALALPRELRGSGAEVHNEVAICWWVRKRGWRLVYDPAVLVDHYPGPRFDSDKRGRPAPRAMQDAAYNLVSCLLSVEPGLFWRRALYGLLVGDRATPGLARGVVGLLLAQWDVVERVIPSVTGQVLALADFTRGRRVEMDAFQPHRQPDDVSGERVFQRADAQRTGGAHS